MSENQNKMDFKNILSKRTGIYGIKKVVSQAQVDEKSRNELYNLLYDNDITTAYQAAWAMCHFSVLDNEWLFGKQDELIDNVLVCTHSGKRRLILTLLLKQPLKNDPPRLDFLDFCLERMYSKNEPPGVKSLCIKISYQLCRSIPELLNEYTQMLELVETELLPPSLQCAKNNMLKRLNSKPKNRNFKLIL